MDHSNIQPCLGYTLYQETMVLKKNKSDKMSKDLEAGEFTNCAMDVHMSPESLIRTLYTHYLRIQQMNQQAATINLII